MFIPVLIIRLTQFIDCQFKVILIYLFAELDDLCLKVCAIFLLFFLGSFKLLYSLLHFFDGLIQFLDLLLL